MDVPPTVTMGNATLSVLEVLPPTPRHHPLRHPRPRQVSLCHLTDDKPYPVQSVLWED